MDHLSNLPRNCPSCGRSLYVQALCCAECGTRVEGAYALPGLLRLPPDDLRFLTEFIMAQGSFKEMASRRGLSYPTLRNRFDDIVDRLRRFEDSDND